MFCVPDRVPAQGVIVCHGFDKRAEKDKCVKGIALWAVPHDHGYNIKRFIRRTRGWLGWRARLFFSFYKGLATLIASYL